MTAPKSATVDIEELENVIKQALPMTMRNESPCEARAALRMLASEVRSLRLQSDGWVGPIPMYLTCPKCNARHIDEGEFATKPHHTHSCQSCGLTWRPSLVHTVGVEFLPGFKNQDAAQ